MKSYDVIVIGGGQAGLAAGYHLQRAGLKFLILEASDEATGSWKHYYDSLKIFSPARYSSLPGMPFPGAPDRYPTRNDVIDYLRAYVQHFNLPIQTNTRVEKVERVDQKFHVFAGQPSPFIARSVIAATGAFSRPHQPAFESLANYRGLILHSSDYLRPQPFAGQRVLIVGGGNSAVQIAVELAGVAQVTLTSRDPLRFWRQRFLGRDLHFWLKISGYDTWKRQFAQWSPAAINQPGVLDTGKYQAAFQSGNPTYQPLFNHFTAQGVAYADGTKHSYDSVIFATGFRPNLTYLETLGALDAFGNARHRYGISQTTHGLYFVGLSEQRSFASATLRGVGRDAAYVIRDLTQYLNAPSGQFLKLRCCATPQS